MSTGYQHLDADHIRAALHGIEHEIVESFRGAPNRRLSSKKELRWGNKGSLSLQLAGSKAGLWYDHELGRGGNIFDLIMNEQGCDFVEALRFAQQFIGGAHPAPRKRIIPTVRIVRDDLGDDLEEQRRIEQAIAIWCGAQPLRGTIGEKYLRSRSIEVTDEALDALGFHPACPWGYGTTVPAVVGLIRDAITGEATGIHRTALTPSGGKIGRKVLGPKSGGAIKLSGESLVTTELTIAEGIETALSAVMFGFTPTWSVIDAGGIAGFPVLPHVQRLTIIVDNDASGAGQKATAECRARWEAAGHHVRTVMPPTVGDDLNDVLQAQGNQQ